MRTIKKPSELEMRRSLGLRTVTEAAKEIGEDPRTLYYHQGRGHCVQPMTRLEGKTRLYYTADEVELLAAYFAQRGRR